MSNVHSLDQAVHGELGSAQREIDGRVAEVTPYVWSCPPAVFAGSAEECERWDGLS